MSVTMQMYVTCLIMKQASYIRDRSIDWRGKIYLGRNFVFRHELICFNSSFEEQALYAQTFELSPQSE